MLLSLLLGLRSEIRSRTVRGLVYGPGSHHAAEVHAPLGADGESPVVVVLRPRGVSVRKGRSLGRIFAARGLVAAVASIGEPADALRDAAAACAWASERAAEFGGDPRRLFVFGAADGAGVAARLALDSQWLAEAGARQLRGAVGFEGLYDLGGVEAASLARRDAAPLLLVAGRDSGSETNLAASRLAGAVRAAGGPVAEIHCPAFGRAPMHHLIRALPLSLIALDEVERFIRLGSLEPAL